VLHYFSFKLLLVTSFTGDHFISTLNGKRKLFICAILWYCILLLMITVAATDEVPGLRNTAVINGSTVSFSCIIHAPESEVCWIRQIVLPEKVEFFYVQGNLKPACGNDKCNVILNNENDRYTLTINSVQHHDAGFYQCIECAGPSLHAAELIVLQSAHGSEGM